MTPTLPVRLGMSVVTGGLLMAALAYDWLGNLAHEIVGTAIFALAITHNTFNRRWYARVSKGGRDLRGRLNVLVIAVLASVMLTLLTTSLMVSRSLFEFLPQGGGYGTRRIHGMAAYWLLVIVSVHIGLRWSMIMNVVAGWFGFDGTGLLGKSVLRLLTAATVAYGVYSSLEIGLGSRLMAQVTMDFWEFDRSVTPFFLHLASIAGLYICITHYSLKLLR